MVLCVLLLFLQCCLEIATKSSCLLTQVLSKCNWRTIHCPEVLMICIEHMKRLTQIHTADQQPSWGKLHVSKSDLGSPNCPHSAVSTLCCDSTPSCSLPWMPTVHIPLQAHPVELIAMEIFFMVLIDCSTFLQKYLHVKNHGNF